jgi:hypothetical protein
VKNLCTVFCLILAVLALSTASYSAKAQSKPISQDFARNGLSVAGPVLIKAHELLNSYGNRPHWSYKPFQQGEDVPASQSVEVVAHLIACESESHSVKIVDSNDYFSYGVLQIQSSTWAQFEHKSGLTGDPMNSVDAVQMGLWAVEHGYAWKWSCAKLTRIVS